MHTITFILTLLLIAVSAASIVMIYNLQKKCIQKDAQIKMACDQVKYWETYNIGIIGDMAFLIDSNDQEKKTKIKAKWKGYFAQKKKMVTQKTYGDAPSAN